MSVNDETLNEPHPRDPALRVRLRERLMRTARLFCPGTVWLNGAIVLLYHRVEDIPSDPFSVAPQTFLRQLTMLRETRRVVSVGELVQRLTQGAPLDGYVAISFDDGYRCTLTQALPRLRGLDLSASLFVDTARLGREPDALTPAQIGELAQQGFEIGSHGVWHKDLRSLSDTHLHDELAVSRETLIELAGQLVDGLAYPFGAHDARVRLAAQRAGFRYACSCRQHDNVHPGDDPFRLKRLEINYSDDLENFRHKLAGANAGVYGRYYALRRHTRSWLDEGIGEGA